MNKSKPCIHFPEQSANQRPWRNTFWNLDKYILQFGQIHFTIWTNIFGQSGGGQPRKVFCPEAARWETPPLYFSHGAATMVSRTKIIFNPKWKMSFVHKPIGHLYCTFPSHSDYWQYLTKQKGLEEENRIFLTLSDAGVWRLNLGRRGTSKAPPTI